MERVKVAVVGAELVGAAVAYDLRAAGVHAVVLEAAGELAAISWSHGQRRVYALDGGVFTAGTAITWLRSIGLIIEVEETTALAASVADTGDVRFLPAITGLSAPWWDGDARGAFTGITAGTTRAPPGPGRPRLRCVPGARRARGGVDEWGPTPVFLTTTWRSIMTLLPSPSCGCAPHFRAHVPWDRRRPSGLPLQASRPAIAYTAAATVCRRDGGGPRGHERENVARTPLVHACCVLPLQPLY